MIITRTIEIKWADADCNTDQRVYENLKVEGFHRANKMIEDGYHSGELIYEDDDHYFRGWWSVADKEGETKITNDLGIEE